MLVENGGVLRVLIVDDHEVLRTGTRQVLEASGDIVVVGEADDGNAALALIDELDPNVVLIDIRLPDRSGIDVARHLTLTHPDVRVVILSAYDDDDFVRAALEAGVTGYLLKTMARDELVAAVRAAAQGTTVLDPVLSPRLGRSPQHVGTEHRAPSDVARARNRRAGGRRAVQQGDRGAPRRQCPDRRGSPQPRLHQARCGVAYRAGPLRVDPGLDLIDTVGERPRALTRISRAGLERAPDQPAGRAA